MNHPPVAHMQSLVPAADAAPPSLAEAQDYCRRLARSHYENFSVARGLLPRRLRQHFYNVYAYCRWSDDLADEVQSPQQALELLDCWEEQLRRCYAGEARHPVFVALRHTIREFRIPQQPLADLLTAFRQDQHLHGYDTFDQLLGYCRNSANPVGRIVLYLGESYSEENTRWADFICTGLQLANFWQDVRRDDEMGRRYLPAETMRMFGYTPQMFAARQTNDEFRAAIRHEVDRAEDYLRRGTPLIDRVEPQLRLQVALFQAGGLEVLRAIHRIDYDVWHVRPMVSKVTKLRLLVQSWWRHRRRCGRGGKP